MVFVVKNAVFVIENSILDDKNCSKFCKAILNSKIPFKKDFLSFKLFLQLKNSIFNDKSRSKFCFYRQNAFLMTKGHSHSISKPTWWALLKMLFDIRWNHKWVNFTVQIIYNSRLQDSCRNLYSFYLQEI